MHCMNKLEFMRLWDVYSGLLTPTQQEMTNAYFNLDLTVSEIAEQKGVSRQAVSECLSQSKKQLEGYESTLHHSRMLTEGAGGPISFCNCTPNMPQTSQSSTTFCQGTIRSRRQRPSQSIQKVNKWHYSHHYRKD